MQNEKLCIIWMHTRTFNFKQNTTATVYGDALEDGILIRAPTCVVINIQSRINWIHCHECSY